MAMPKLKIDEISQRIRSHQGPIDAFSFKRYLKEIDEIAKHNACAAFNLKGVLYSIHQPDDCTEALSNFQKALNIVNRADRPLILANYSKALFHYKKRDEFAETSLQTISEGIKTYGANSEFTKTVFFETLMRLLILGRFIDALQMINTTIKELPFKWAQQDAFVRFISEQKDIQILLNDMQKQEVIYQTILLNKDICIKNLNYSIMPYGDCIITFTLDSSPDEILEITEHKLQLMMKQEFLPERFNLLFN